MWKGFIWRVIYATVGFIVFTVIVPLFCQVIGFPLGGPAWELLHVCAACLAVLYVLFGPTPVTPWGRPIA